MKTYIFILSLSVISACGQSGNNKDNRPATSDTTLEKNVITPVPDKADTIITNPSTVDEIKSAYSAIQDKLQSGHLDSTSIKYDCKGERSGTVTYFSSKGSLVMIKHSYSEYSHYSAVDRYFLSSDTLFFAHLHGISWTFDSGNAAGSATKDDITELRYYIAKEKPLLCLEKKYIHRSHASDNPIPENVENKQVKCQNIAPVLKDFSNLLKFKTGVKQDCLEK